MQTSVGALVGLSQGRQSRQERQRNRAGKVHNGSKQGQSMPLETKLVPDKRRKESNCEIDSHVKRVTGNNKKGVKGRPVVKWTVGRKEGGVEEEETSTL